MQDTRLELALQDGGQPACSATVHLTLTMPGCPMTPSYPEAVEQADGLYAAATIPTRAGAWRADADVWLQGKGVRFTFFFSRISPVIAAAAMATSSLLVVGNSLRATRFTHYARGGKQARNVTRSMERRAE
jgi:hypothetical protein